MPALQELGYDCFDITAEGLLTNEILIRIHQHLVQSDIHPYGRGYFFLQTFAGLPKDLEDIEYLLHLKFCSGVKFRMTAPRVWFSTHFDLPNRQKTRNIIRKLL